MPKHDVPDLSHLSGREIEKVAEALSAGKIRAILAARDDIAAMKMDDFNKLSELAAATRDNCGGFGCG